MRRFQGLDQGVILSILALLAIGLLALSSAAFQRFQSSGADYLSRQLTWMGLGGLLAAVLVVVDYHRWLEWAYWLYGLGVVLLVLVLEIGVVRGGAQRWLTVGSISLQPSEFAKVATILALARYLGARRDAGSPKWRAVLGASVLLLVPMALILMQPNLGTASVFAAVGMGMLLVWGIPLRALLGVLGAGAAALPVGWHFLADYQRSRLLVFLNPNLDPLGAGYTVIQSKIAMGSGFLFGKGWLSGTQSRLNFLPERHTDFIFSVIGEEWGFLGTSVCLGLLAFFIIRSLRIAVETRDPYGRLFVVGLVTMLAVHTVVNAGMSLGLMPVVGLPLPFLSYGGSWLLTSLVAVGMILSVGVRRPLT